MRMSDNCLGFIPNTFAAGKRDRDTRYTTIICIGVRFIVFAFCYLMIVFKSFDSIRFLMCLAYNTCLIATNNIITIIAWNAL